ncbi:hypothetical protein [Phyllobacterium sp. P5_D12]
MSGLTLGQAQNKYHAKSDVSNFASTEHDESALLLQIQGGSGHESRSFDNWDVRHCGQRSSEEFTDPEAKKIISICNARQRAVTAEIARCIRRYDPDGKQIVFSAEITSDRNKSKKTK